MKSALKSTLLAAILATGGVAAFSHSVSTGGDGYMMGAGPMEMMLTCAPMGAGGPGFKGKMDPTRMQARSDRHFSALKAELKLTPAQEGAWTSFKTAVQPRPDMRERYAQRAELAKLPTLERLEKMKALRTQHMTDVNTAMDQRADATKAFYASLTPEQQKVFDASALPGPGRAGHMGGGWGHGPEQPKR